MMHHRDVRTAAATYAKRFGGASGISAWHFPGVSEEDAAALIPTQHRTYRSTTAGDLRGAGFEIRTTGRAGHVTIKFPGEVTDEEIERLVDCFHPEKVRPQYSEEGNGASN